MSHLWILHLSIVGRGRQQKTTTLLQVWLGKVRNRAHAPQYGPKKHFSCGLIGHFEHNYSAPRFGAKKI